MFDVTKHEPQSIPLSTVTQVLESIYEDGQYIPLLIDPSGRVDTFFQYSGGDFHCVLANPKEILVKAVIQKTMSIQDAKEKLRKHVVNALRYGKCLLLNLEDTAFNFESFWDGDYFPRQLLEQGGKSLLQEEVYSKLIRDEDKTSGCFVPNDKFKVCLSSKFKVENYMEFLQQVLPMEMCFHVIILENH